MDKRENKGVSAGMGISVIGLLLVLAVLAIKFVGPDPISILGFEIGNPEGVYTGIYFLGGIAVGIIIMILGAAISRRKKKKTTKEAEKELEDELEELEEEIEEEGICPTCGAVIPLDAEECPECGEELEPPEEEMMDDVMAENILDIENCPICGAEVSEEVDECPECGEPLDTESDEDVFEDM